MRKLTVVTLALALAASGTSLAASMSKDEYKAARTRIAAEAQAEREKCGSRHANAADICVARARGALKVARAELEATYKPSPKTNYAAAMARAEATEAVALEECDDKASDMRKACVKDAKAATVRAKAEALSRK
jgi:hypothetical protein